MIRRMRLLLALVVSAGVAGASVHAQSGRGTLEGTWNFSTLTPLERPAEFANRPALSEAEAAAWVAQNLERNNRDRRDGGAGVDVARAVNDYWFDRGDSLAANRGQRMTSLVIDPADGRIPALTPEARQRVAAEAAENRAHPADGSENRSLQERCLSFNAGPPMLPGPYNNIVRIYEMPAFIVIVNEMIHDARIIPLDDRPRPPDTLQRWQGESRGRWEGATLIVETTNFTDDANVRGADEHLRLTERFTRVDPKTLHYEFTVNDPTAFTRAWTALLPMTLTDEPMFEYACHEGNHALEDILRGARYQERQR